MPADLPVDAVVVVDMQNSFLHPNGRLYAARGGPLVDIEATVAANCRLVAVARSASIPVIFTRHCYRPGYVDVSLTARDVYRTHHGALLAGSWDAAIVDELAFTDAVFVDKNRMDAFYGTALETVLRGLSVNRLAISGIITNACVDTTTRSAAMRDFAVTVVSDCCTTYSESDQTASLHAIAKYGFARLLTLAELATTGP
jgi:nicotinamidase-related amidase